MQRSRRCPRLGWTRRSLRRSRRLAKGGYRIGAPPRRTALGDSGGQRAGSSDALGLDFEAKAFYYGPQNTRRNMTGALVGYLGSAEVRNIILRHLTGAF